MNSWRESALSTATGGQAASGSGFALLRRGGEVLSLDEAREQVLNQARAAGYAAGRHQALAEAEAESAVRREQLARQDAASQQQREQVMSAAAQSIENAAQQWQRRALPVEAEVAGLAIDLAIDLAAAVLCREVADRGVAARDAVHRALSELPVGGRVTVRLHPEDIAVLTDGGALDAGVRLQPDASLARGDAVAETADRLVDARLQSAWQRAIATLSEPIDPLEAN